MSAGRATQQRLRIGYYEDFTTLPVVSGVENQVRSATLRRCSLDELRLMMSAGELDGALLPTPDALCLSGVSILPCSTVTAAGASRSFMIFSKRLPTEIQRVLVDKEDYGFASLAELLFPKKMMIRPSFTFSDFPLDPAEYDLMQSDGYDAYLLTGKNAIFVNKEAFAFSWDLTLAWHEYSRLPYVINCWVIRKGVNAGRVTRELAELARKNEGDIDVADKASTRFGITQTGARKIYRKAFFTGFDTPIITSLRQFGKELSQEKIRKTQSINVYTEPKSGRPV